MVVVVGILKVYCGSVPLATETLPVFFVGEGPGLIIHHSKHLHDVLHHCLQGTMPGTKDLFQWASNIIVVSCKVVYQDSCT